MGANDLGSHLRLIMLTLTRLWFLTLLLLLMTTFIEPSQGCGSYLRSTLCNTVHVHTLSTNISLNKRGDKTTHISAALAVNQDYTRNTTFNPSSTLGENNVFI